MLCTKSEYKLNGYKMRKINALFFIFALFATPAAYASSGFDASSFLQYWKGNVTSVSMSYCSASVPKESTIGVEKFECTGDHKNDNCGNDTRWTQCMMMMIAQQINDKGAYFCPTNFCATKSHWERTNKEKNPVITRYFMPDNADTSDCMWLCKSGYSGDRCQISSYEYNGANPESITRDSFDDLSLKSPHNNVEHQVAMFHGSSVDKHTCKRKQPVEHDMILAISGWTVGGHGVKVQPFIVRSDFDLWYYGPAWPVVTAVGGETLLCQSGYVANSNGTDCEAVDPELQQMVQDAGNTGAFQDLLCDGFSMGDFSSVDKEWFWHNSCTRDGHANTGGYAFRCIETGYGFTVGADAKNCSDCNLDSPRNGLDSLGNCVRCPNGQIFSAADDGCAAVTALDRNRLYYGPGKDDSTPINDQCWIAADSSDYSECVWGLMPTAIFRGLVQSQYIERIGGVSIGGGGSDGGSGGGSGGNGGSGGGSGGGNNDEPWVADDYHYEGLVGGGSGGGSGIKTMETGLGSNIRMY